ncbi:hypothetical protein PACTADRAFT_21397, partial [Pachysolen tannophilus NRRL Y-2460]
KIVVVGAGVIGLTTAYILLKNNYQVSLIASFFPSDSTSIMEYTSMKAGAYYAPGGTHDTPLEERKIDLPSYREILKIAQDHPEAGVWIKEAIQYIDKSHKEDLMEALTYDGPWWKNHVNNYKKIPENEFPNDKIGFGFKFDTFIISPIPYLHFLLSECIKLGLNFRRYKIENLDSAIEFFINPITKNYEKGDIVINCTGNGSIKLVPQDKKTFTIRGQTILVENNSSTLKVVRIKDENYPGEFIGIIPRKEGGSLLNGIYSFRDNSSSIDYDLANRIIERCLEYAPELIDPNFSKNKPYLKIISHNVGLRPGRESGPRIEKEITPKKTLIIHNYGASNVGYIKSFGLAEKVLDLIKQ